MVTLKEKEYLEEKKCKLKSEIETGKIVSVALIIGIVFTLPTIIIPIILIIMLMSTSNTQEKRKSDIAEINLKLIDEED